MAQSKPTYSKSFRRDALDLVQVSGKSIAPVAKDLGIAEQTLRNWSKQAAIDQGGGETGAHTSEERQELARLRRENKTLVMERDILQKAAAFFAKEMR
jgi:transposase